MGCVSLKNSDNSQDLQKFRQPSISKLLPVSRKSILSDYKIIRSLGDGAFGHVREVEDRLTQVHRASKTVKISNMDSESISEILKEVNILKELDHPGIIKIFEVYQDSAHLHIITELCTGGDLFERLATVGCLSENLAAKYMREIVSAVKFCHETGIAHRDLKPENILFEDESRDARLKLIDFGNSKVFKQCKKMKSLSGTPYYIAPEVVTGVYTEKCDVWSLGVILYIMLSGTQPFKGRNFREISANINDTKLDFSGKTWKNVSLSAIKLLKKTLNKNPKKRISIGRLFYDPWLVTRSEELVPDKVLASKALKKLTIFQCTNKLHLCTLSFMTHFYTAAQDLKELSHVFDSLDTNQDGKLSRNEIEKGIEQYLGINDFDLDKIFEQCDINENGFIDFSEFATAVFSSQLEFSIKNLFKMFNALDKDGNGVISKEELQIAIGYSDENLKNVLAEIDLDRDGAISRKEFIKSFLKIARLE